MYLFYDSRRSKSDTSCETTSIFTSSLCWCHLISSSSQVLPNFLCLSMTIDNWAVYQQHSVCTSLLFVCSKAATGALFVTLVSHLLPTQPNVTTNLHHHHSMQLRTTQQWSYFGEYPKRPCFPCFPGQTDFAVVVENDLAVVLANNAKWLLIRTLVWIDSRIHSVGRLSEKDYLKDIFQ